MTTKATPRPRTLFSEADYIRVLCLWARHQPSPWGTLHEQAKRVGHRKDLRWLSMPYRMRVSFLLRERVPEIVAEEDVPTLARVLPMPKYRGVPNAIDHAAEVLSFAKRSRLTHWKASFDLAERVHAYRKKHRVQAARRAVREPAPSLSDVSPAEFARAYEGPLPKVEAVQKQYALSLPEAAAVVRAGAKPAEATKDAPPSSALLEELHALREEVAALRSLNRALRTQLVHWMPQDDLL